MMGYRRIPGCTGQLPRDGVGIERKNENTGCGVKRVCQRCGVEGNAGMAGGFPGIVGNEPGAALSNGLRIEGADAVIGRPSGVIDSVLQPGKLCEQQRQDQREDPASMAQRCST